MMPANEALPEDWAARVSRGAAFLAVPWLSLWHCGCFAFRYPPDALGLAQAG
jgi:hypothetical protein